MKKTILVLVSLIFGVLSTIAQTDSETQKVKKVKFGLRTGYEFQVSNSNLDYKLNIPYIGILSEVSLNKKWSLQLELNLRSEKRERLFSDGLKESINEVYLTVPVFLKYNVSNTFKVYTGTQVLSVSFKNDIFGIKKWNGILGIEYDFTKNFFLDARFRHGFEKRESNNNFRDNRISVGIGYKF